MVVRNGWFLNGVLFVAERRGGEIAQIIRRLRQ